jgi:hypothetical protein
MTILIVLCCLWPMLCGDVLLMTRCEVRNFKLLRLSRSSLRNRRVTALGPQTTVLILAT